MHSNCSVSLLAYRQNVHRYEIFQKFISQKPSGICKLHLHHLTKNSKRGFSVHDISDVIPTTANTSAIVHMRVNWRPNLTERFVCRVSDHKMETESKKLFCWPVIHSTKFVTTAVGRFR